MRDLKAPQDSCAIIQAIVGIARNFNLQVMVEGVETAHQVAVLRQLGCHEMQGYFFCQPMPAGELTEFLEGQLAA